jgi:hypothetical protein
LLTQARNQSGLNGILTIQHYTVAILKRDFSRWQQIGIFCMEHQNTNVKLPAGTTSDQRPSPRRRMLKTAIASYNDHKITMEVVLRDMSETGVKLKLNSPDPLPEHFTLYIELDGITVDCQVVWRRGREIGATFISEIKHSEPLRVQKVQATTIDRKVSLRKRPRV